MKRSRASERRTLPPRYGARARPGLYVTLPRKRPHSFLRETAVSSAKDRGLSTKRPRSFFDPSGVLSECRQIALSTYILTINGSFRLLFDNIGSSHEGLSQTIMRASSFAFGDALPLVQRKRRNSWTMIMRVTHGRSQEKKVECNLLSYTPLGYWLLWMVGYLTSPPRTSEALTVNML